MDERILIEFKRGGQRVPVTSFRAPRPGRHDGGLVLEGETSAWPRGIVLNLTSRNDVTAHRMHQVRVRHHWLNPKRYELEVAREGRRLRLEGVDREALPPGRYEVALRVGGLELAQVRHRVRLAEKGKPTIVLEEKPSTRRLVHSRPVAEYDRRLRQIINHPRSRLDGMSAANWLTEAAHRDRRKACLLNLLAKLAVLPTVEDPLMQHVRHVFFADVDRVYGAVGPAFLERLQTSSRFKKDKTVHSTHAKLKSLIPNAHGMDYDLVSYREGAQPSMQVVVAVPPSHVGNKTHYADLDIDLGNPTLDVKSFVIHIGELLDPGRTNHLKLRKALGETRAGEFLYYSVQKN